MGRARIGSIVLDFDMAQNGCIQTQWAKSGIQVGADEF
jgi:hypothetical protein